MENYYKNSASIKGIEKACDIAQVGRSIDEDKTNRKKRSRESMEDLGLNDLFHDVYKEIVFTESFPTFRTYVLGAFYLLLSFNEDSEYYNQVMEYVLKFREIITAADREIYNGRIKKAYFLLVDDMVLLLKRSRHVILLFHLDARRPP